MSPFKKPHCSAIAATSGKPCSWSGSKTVGGKPYCAHHAAIARKAAPALMPEKQYQEAAAPAPEPKIAANPRFFADEVASLVEAGISPNALQWVLEGWARSVGGKP